MIYIVYATCFAFCTDLFDWLCFNALIFASQNLVSLENTSKASIAAAEKARFICARVIYILNLIIYLFTYLSVLHLAVVVVGARILSL